MKTILHSDDINLLTFWQNSLEEESVIIDNFDELKSIQNSIIIINDSAFGSKQKESIVSFNAKKNLVLVLHRTPNLQTAKEVLSYGAKGYGNALMKAHFLVFAIQTMKDGLIWIHPELTSQLISDLPTKEGRNVSWVLDKLSDREKEVALLLKDGCTYKTAGEQLSITPRTIKAHAQSIYKKLYLKDRLALALLLN